MQIYYLFESVEYRFRLDMNINNFLNSFEWNVAPIFINNFYTNKGSSAS